MTKEEHEKQKHGEKEVMGEVMEESKEEKGKKRVVVPGEVIVSGQNYLPGDGTIREKNDIIAIKFGLVQIDEMLVKIISLSGAYIPRRGNIVIGKVLDVTQNGWIIDVLSPYSGFLPAREFRRHSMRRDTSSLFSIGDMLIAEVIEVTGRGIDLTMMGPGLHKLEGGMIIKINSNKVPRVIGKKGSMVNMIKQETGCNIAVGQNGLIWINGENIEKELLAKEAISLITEKSFIGGLTEQIKEFLEKHKKPKKEVKE